MLVLTSIIFFSFFGCEFFSGHDSTVSRAFFGLRCSGRLVRGSELGRERLERVFYLSRCILDHLANRHFQADGAASAIAVVLQGLRRAAQLDDAVNLGVRPGIDEGHARHAFFQRQLGDIQLIEALFDFGVLILVERG
jgi:hypothetical protein